MVTPQVLFVWKRIRRNELLLIGTSLHVFRDVEFLYPIVRARTQTVMENLATSAK